MSTAGRSPGGVFMRSAGGVRGRGVTLSSRYVAGSALVYDGKMWIIGRYADYGLLGDVWESSVWNSEDGVTWTQITDDGGWTPTAWPRTFVFDNKMWVQDITGNQPTRVYGMWSSVDGETWTKEGEISCYLQPQDVVGSELIYSFPVLTDEYGFPWDDYYEDLYIDRYPTPYYVRYPSDRETPMHRYVGNFQSPGGFSPVVSSPQYLTSCSYGGIHYVWYKGADIKDYTYPYVNLDTKLNVIQSNSGLTSYSLISQTDYPGCVGDIPKRALYHDGSLWAFGPTSLRIDHEITETNVDDLSISSFLLSYDSSVWQIRGNTVRNTTDGTFTTVNPSIWP